MSFALALLCVCGIEAASASVPGVVVSSQSQFGPIISDPTKVVMDAGGNIYFVSTANGGSLWRIPAGTTVPTQIVLPNYSAAVVNTSATGAGHTVTYIGITNPGSGYTTAPTLTLSAPTANTTVTGCATLPAGATAQATVTLSGGSISNASIPTPGACYLSPPTVTFSAPPAGGVQATGVAYTTAIYTLGGPTGLAVDSYGDVIVGGSYNYHAFFLQNINGVLCTSCNAAGNGPLDLTNSNGFGALDGYYGAMSDVAVDPNGLVYLAMKSCNNPANCAGFPVFTFQTSGSSTTAASIAKVGTTQIFLSKLPGTYAQGIAVDGAGHFYFADGLHVYATSTTSPSPVAIGTFSTPVGLTVDASGNLYVSDNAANKIYEIPNESGTLNPAHQFIVASPAATYYGFAFDPAGNIYSGGGYYPQGIIKTTLGGLNFGSVPVKTAAPSVPLTYWFNAAVTPASIPFMQGTSASSEFKLSYGSCAAGTSYTAGQSCTQNVSFTPSSTGIRTGAAEMLNAANQAFATAYFTGIGTGPALTVDPGTQTALAAKAAWSKPSAVALDAANNVYVADAGANTVQVISSGGAATASIGSGLLKPGGVAVDGAGNVFIADTGNSRVVEVPNENGTLNTADQVVLSIPGSTALTAPEGIAVDSLGALYVADTGNKRVLRLSTAFGLASLTATTVGSGYTAPVAVATDNSGNVYVADQSANQVDVVNLLGAAAPGAVTGLSSPTSVSVDASGAIYIVNSGTLSVVRVPSVAGVPQSSAAASLSSALGSPTGVAVNGAGNVVISDAGLSNASGIVAPNAYMLLRTGGTLNFGPVNISLSSSQQTITLSSAGTATATLAAPAYAASGTGTADYSVAGVGSGNNPACSDGASVAVGASCSYGATLSPVVGSGTLTETLTFSSNAVNTPALTELLTGTATNLALTAVTLSLTGSSTPVYGQPITVTAAVTTSKPGVAPTGSVTFSLNGTVSSGKIALSSTAPYTATYTFTATPSPTVSAGANAITANYSGDANDAASNASALIVTVAKQSSTSANVATTSASIAPIVVTQLSQTPGSSFYFVATVSPTIEGIPGGVVELVAANTTSPILATATLASVSQGTGLPALQRAQLKYTPPSALGQYQYQVIYVGDANFVGSTSAAATVQVVSEGYTLALPTASYAVAAGNSVVVPITVTGIGGYTGNVTVTALNNATGAVTSACTGLPANAVCVFSPGIVALSNGAYPLTNPSGVFNLTLNTSVAPAMPYPVPGSIFWPGGLVGLVSLALGMRKRKGVLRNGLLLVACGAALCGSMIGLSGCGSGTTAYATPTGTSSVTVTFSGSPIGGYPTTPPNPPNITNTVQFQLTVQ